MLIIPFAAPFQYPMPLIVSSSHYSVKHNIEPKVGETSIADGDSDTGALLCDTRRDEHRIAVRAARSQRTEQVNAASTSSSGG